jgi:hypothetical protein
MSGFRRNTLPICNHLHIYILWLTGSYFIHAFPVSINYAYKAIAPLFDNIGTTDFQADNNERLELGVWNFVRR